MSRPNPVSVGDEFLDRLLTQTERTNALLADIRDRLPEPPAPSPQAVGEPTRAEFREPDRPNATSPKRTGKPHRGH